MTSSRNSRHFKAVLFAVLFLFIQGCGALPISVMGALPVVVSGASGGVAYTVTNIAYKTFSFPIAEVESSTYRALAKMEMGVVDAVHEEDGINITARTKKLNIYIWLEKITVTTTKIKVNAKRGAILKDKSTATEIIEQVGRLLEGIDNGRPPSNGAPGAPGTPSPARPMPNNMTDYRLEV